MSQDGNSEQKLFATLNSYGDAVWWKVGDTCQELGDILAVI